MSFVTLVNNASVLTHDIGLYPYRQSLSPSDANQTQISSTSLDISDSNSDSDSDSAREFHRRMQRVLWWYILVASCIGLLLNGYCAAVLIKIRRRQVHLTLLTIAVADLAALCLILTPHVGALVIDRRSLFTATFCKLHTFLLHSCCAYAIWCWVLLSMVRYTAVFHPYKHLRFQACGAKYGLLVTLIFCMFTELWAPLVVTADTAHGFCTLNTDAISVTGFQRLNSVEILLTYILPFACIALANAAVFGRIYVCSSGLGAHGLTRLRADSLVTANSPQVPQSAAILSVSKQKRLKRQKFNSLTRLLALVAISLLLNLPNTVIRLLNTNDPTGAWLPEPYNDLLQKVSYALSYTHYAINCIYLRLAVTGGRRSTTSASRRGSEEPTAGGNNSRYYYYTDERPGSVARYSIAGPTAVAVGSATLWPRPLRIVVSCHHING